MMCPYNQDNSFCVMYIPIFIYPITIIIDFVKYPILYIPGVKVTMNRCNKYSFVYDVSLQSL